jgi:hypothetical protein
MKHNLIKTDNYLLVVDDDSKIILGDYYIDDYLLLRKCVVDDSEYWSNRKDYKKLIAHLPLNGAPYLDGVDRLPPNWRDGGEEDDVEKLATSFIQEKLKNSSQRVGVLVGYIEGYNKAREKYKYMEEVIHQAYLFGKSMMSPNNFEKYLQSLQQPKLPIAFECEIEPRFKHIGSTKEVKGSGSRIKNKHAGNPKTFINSEGRTEWVGEYIYN